MKRFRWALLVLTGLIVVGAASSAVLAGSSKTQATYWNHAIVGSSPTAGAWLAYGQTATWTFDASELQSALPGSVSLNFAGLSRHTLGGTGYNTSLRVVVTGGTTGGTFTATLVNPWRPHVAYNASTGVGWQAYGSLLLPNSAWRNASLLTVKVSSLTSNTAWSVPAEGLMLGYATVE